MIASFLKHPKNKPVHPESSSTSYSKMKTLSINKTKIDPKRCECQLLNACFNITNNLKLGKKEFIQFTFSSL
jgi:hypothetical protein